FFLFFAAVAHAQDAAEPAPPKSAPKAAPQKPPRHVYTEEDLKKLKILTPEDQVRVEARKNRNAAAPEQENAERLPEDAGTPPESLGDVARRYRMEKSARAAEQADKDKFTPFPYHVSEGSLASPKPGVEPRAADSPRLNAGERAGPGTSPPPHIAPFGAGPGARISPFQPRPFAAAPHAIAGAPRMTVRTREAVRVEPVNPAPSTESPGLQQVRVQQGESWWKLARRTLGSGARWPEI